MHNHEKLNFLADYYLIICLNDSMTLELKKNHVLINDLQYIYKHKHIFNKLNTQCKIHNRHICHSNGHSSMHIVHWGEY